MCYLGLHMHHWREIFCLIHGTNSHVSNTISQNEINFITSNRFQYYSQKITRHFHNVLNSLTKFAKEIIVPVSFDQTPPRDLYKPKIYTIV